MRLVQAGYERCAADYQTRIKALNAQTQVLIDDLILIEIRNEHPFFFFRRLRRATMTIICTNTSTSIRKTERPST